MTLASYGGRSVAGIVLAQGRHLRYGNLTVTLPGGERRHFRTEGEGPDADLHVRDWVFFYRFLRGGALGFAESYIAGECDTSDLPTLLKFAAVNFDSISGTLSGTAIYRWVQRAAHGLRPNSIRGARRNIAAHYDLGNRFYEAWLDPTMTYSSAVFEDGRDSLDEAQAAKYRLMAECAGIRPGDKVLEIGCGWGGFSEWAAREIGCDVTGLTISDAQCAYALERISRAGLAEKVDIRLQDYRHITGTFDRIVSIEMFEAVGEKNWPVFFNRLHERLRAGGAGALQVITIADRFFDRYKSGADFIQRYIFPGGMLPSMNALKQEAISAGLKWNGAGKFADHYARTLELWRRRFEAAWPEIEPLGFDERFQRMWRYYLAYCEAGFATRRIDVVQVGLSKP